MQNYFKTNNIKKEDPQQINVYYIWKLKALDDESHLTECEVNIDKVPAINRELYSTKGKINPASIRILIEASDARKSLLEC